MRQIMIAVLTVTFLISLNVFADNVYNYQADKNGYLLRIAFKEGIGEYLTDEKGRSLYWFKKDSPEQSVCNGECLVKWPVYYREQITPPTGTTTADFSFITRTDGTKQTTFRGYPLYYFFKDKSSKNTFGQGIKNVWFVIDPARFPNKK